jgi:hypothetical protein
MKCVLRERRSERDFQQPGRRPKAIGSRTGTLTIKDFNTNSPHTVALSGTGS